MEKLTMQRLRLENFQKFKQKEIEFGEEQTVIRGGNGQGKTTVYSAMTWLLFGKDYKGSTDTGRGAFDIKHREGGLTVDHTDTSVEGEFTFNGRHLRLKRVLHEVWSMGDNARHTGDITQCYIDDVPKQVGEYQKFISSIIDEREFRMITDIHYFLSLDNKIQREYLCSMAGVSELKDICKGNKEWLEFLDEITGKSLSDFLKILDAERKRLKDDESKIAPMIEALENSLPEESGSREEAEKLKKDILAELELYGRPGESVIDEAKKKKIEALRKELSSLSIQLTSVIRAKQSEHNRLSLIQQEELDRKNAEKKSHQKRLETLRSELEGTGKALANESYKNEIERLQKECDELYDEYLKLTSETFDESSIGLCPLVENHKCDSPLVVRYISEQRSKAIEAYNLAKSEKIRRIIEKGKKAKSSIDEIKENRKIISERHESIKSEIEVETTVIDSIPDYKADEVNSNELARLKNEEIRINGLINDKSEEIERVCASATQLDDISDNRKKAQENLQKVSFVISSIEQRERMLAKIKKLENDDKELNKKIAELDNKEYIAKEINRAQVLDAEKRVNKMFSVVRWQMFELQKNGLYAEICKPTDENGVSSSINLGKMINIGVDIVNTISAFKGICAPVFIDNHESVTTCIRALGQEIDMYVDPKTDLPLTIQIIK